MIVLAAHRGHPGAAFARILRGGLLLSLVGGVALLWPGVPGGLRWPLAACVVCLAAMMAAQTASVWLTARQRGVACPDLALARRAALGGLLFLSSDALLLPRRRASGSQRDFM